MKTKKKKNKKGHKLSMPDLTKAILNTINHNGHKTFTPRQILKKIRAGNNIKDVRKILDKLGKSGTIKSLEDNRYQAKQGHKQKSGSSKTIVGEVDAIRSGAAFVISEDLDSDVFIPRKFMAGAYDKDTVKVELFNRGRGRRKEGKIIKILQRHKTHYTGVYRKFKNHEVIMVTEKYDKFEVDLGKNQGLSPKDYDKVVVKIDHWPDHKAQSMRGTITKILGKSGSNDAEMLSLLVEQGFDLEHKPEVNAEAKALTESATFEVKDGRMDYRDVLTVTIDPADAKDFDDALSFQKLDNGHIEIGIHIADVSEYVKPGSALDKEAVQRGNSVYLVDRVLPMLPENLSNGLCSLRPNEEKYTFSVLCEFDQKSKLISHRFSKTLTKSDKRFAYEDAQELIESGKGQFASELQTMNKIATDLRKKRIKEGSIGFETDEVRFELDEKGDPVSVYVKKRQDAHLMIEDFMLLANRLVAKYIAQKSKGKPIAFPYRIHDQPDPDKLHDFSLLAREFGVKFNLSTPKHIADSMNELMDKAKTDDRYKTLVPLAIRTMSKAEYNTENIGHFGLAFEYYAHFTSPIRRYADLVVHRVLHANLGEDIRRGDMDQMESVCTHISNQERNAQEAERESVKFKQAQYLKEREGEVFTGVIVAIIDKGFFVTLKENLCEGMVPFDSLGERFETDELRSSFTGRKSGRHMRIGDELEVRVEHADLWTRRIDLSWVDNE